MLSEKPEHWPVIQTVNLRGRKKWSAIEFYNYYRLRLDIKLLKAVHAKMSCVEAY